MMEGIIKDFSASDPEFNFGILRYFNPVGAHLSGEIGEDPNEFPIIWYLFFVRSRLAN